MKTYQQSMGPGLVAWQHVASYLAGCAGRGSLPELVDGMARALEADAALLLSLADGAGRVQAVAEAPEDMAPPLSFETAGLATEALPAGIIRLVSGGARAQYPRDPWLRAVAAEAFAAMALTDDQGLPLGTLIVAFREPLTSRPYLESIMRLLACRMEAELQMRRTQAQLAHQQRLNAALQAVAVRVNTASTLEEVVRDTLILVGEALSSKMGRLYLEDAREAGQLRQVGLWTANHAVASRVHCDERRRCSLIDARLARRVMRERQPRSEAIRRQSTCDCDATGDRTVLTHRVAFPILAGTEAVGAVEFYLPAAPAGEPALMETTMALGTMLGRVLERQRAVTALRASEARFRALVEAARDAIVVLDDADCIQLWNHGAELTFGHPASEMVGQPLALALPELGGRLLRLWEDEPGAARLIELGGRHQDGHELPLECSVGHWQVGEACFRSVIMRDVSERHEMDRLKDEFVATVSHELRTPLTVIRGALGLLEAKVVEPGSERHDFLVGVSMRNTDRLAALVNDILDMERMRSGAEQLTLAPLELSTLLVDAAEMLRPLAEQSGVALVVEVSPMTVLADADRVVQVLVNLLANAIKFSPPESMIEVSLVATGAMAQVRVRDHGRGVPAEHRRRIFERFHQVDASDARAHQGTGLGLAICREIVGRHGGTIEVSSPPDGGSCFWFTLRRVDRPQAIAPGELAS